MEPLRVLVGSSTASAATIHGLVYEIGDGEPSAGERGVPGAVDIQAFGETGASGQLDRVAPEGKTGIV